MRLEFTNNKQRELFENNTGFAITLSKEWNNKCSLDKTDLDSYALEALAVAAIKYDETRNDSFKCFSRMVINQTISRKVKSSLSDKNTVENNTSVGLEKLPEESIDDIETSSRYNLTLKTIEDALETVDKRMAKATRMYTMEGYTQKEIAEEMGVAIMTVSQWISKTKKVIASKLIAENIITSSFFK